MDTRTDHRNSFWRTIGLKGFVIVQFKWEKLPEVQELLAEIAQGFVDSETTELRLF